MEMLGKVRRMHLRDKVSLHEISKDHWFIAQHDTQMAQNGR